MRSETKFRKSPLAPLIGEYKVAKAGKPYTNAGKLVVSGGITLVPEEDFLVFSVKQPVNKTDPRPLRAHAAHVTAQSQKSPSKAKNYYLRAKDRAQRGTLLAKLREFSNITVSSQLAAFEPDDRALAILQGQKIARQALSKAGGTYDLDQVRSLLNGISRQAVDKRVQDGTLLAVPGPKNRRRYPTIQFDLDGSLIDGLREIQAALPSKNPWVVLNFLAEENSALDGEKPIDLLRSGNMPSVVAAARSMGEQGF